MKKAIRFSILTSVMGQLSLASLLSCAVLGCGSSGGAGVDGNPGNGSNTPTADAWVNPSNCTISTGNFGTPVAQADVLASMQPGGGASQVSNYLYFPLTDRGFDGDVLWFDLSGSTGRFNGAIQPGTYTISGTDTDPDHCGLCAYIVTPATPPTGHKDGYMAMAGTITVSQVAMVPNGTLTISASGLVFQHYYLDQVTPASKLVGDNCRTAINSVSYTGKARGPAPPI